MEFLDLFIVALMPVLKILLVSAVGLFLATERINLLGADARPYLNNLVFYLFSPSIIFSNLAETITLDSLTNLWFMPVNILLTFIIGSALAWILVKITRAPQHLRSLIIGSCAAGNLGNFPLIIIPAVCDDDNSPFGDSSVCSTDGESYVALSMAIGAVYIWSYVYAIMRLSANKATKEIDSNESTIQDSASGEIPYSEICPEALLLPSRGSPTSQEDTDQAEVPSTKSEGKAKVSLLEKANLHLKKIFGYIDFKKIFAPSTIAAIIGFIVGIISPIRKVLVGDDAPLRAIYNSVSLISDATIPCMTLIIGANLLKGLKTSGVGPLIILGIIAIRYIILPSLGIVIVKAANHFGLVGSDSLYQFTLMLQYSLPPAMNVGTISQLLKTGESECSVIMLWTYAVASLFLTLWSTIFMWIVA
ncbi:protein PIN-LIKES 3-like isoform X2 [Quercus robur]|nr:protein PIN-LIKES 3-like isoform X2 [Quercus robur]XP_050282686.1 protein PIN-LIKES 3-like isoform X2 [Quercus robur]XP_050282687.1 protein PIN-LIKES 3-like isoform X2 [Quercus robur]XP_050282688.1 protein PIN-LIKES 3-like isoform X2 [Quercus robur]XP_050282689.1 protein PIN-LIKES 3-like isoform X2 [Quercus robur]